MIRRISRNETSASTVAPQRAADGAPIRQDAGPVDRPAGRTQLPGDPAEAIDHTLQMLFSCCPTLCRASRDVEHKDELIHSAIVSLDKCIRVLRGSAAALA